MNPVRLPAEDLIRVAVCRVNVVEGAEMCGIALTDVQSAWWRREWSDEGSPVGKPPIDAEALAVFVLL